MGTIEEVEGGHKDRIPHGDGGSTRPAPSRQPVVLLRHRPRGEGPPRPSDGVVLDTRMAPNRRLPEGRRRGRNPRHRRGGALSAFPLPPARQAEAAEEASPSSAAASPIPSGAALTLGSHAGSVLVGLTIEPARPGANELTIYVLGLDGPRPTAALRVHASVDGSDVSLTQCADTCRKGTATLDGGERVAVDVGTAAGGRARFRLPDLPVASGDQVLRRMVATMGALTGYRLDESLTSGLGTTVDTTYAFAAPNSFESHAAVP